MRSPKSLVNELLTAGTAEMYDDFGSSGAGYLDKWMFPFPVEPEAERTRHFAAGKLHLRAVPFTLSADNIADHIKYYAVSTTQFTIPRAGGITVAAEIEARTPGAVPGHILPTTGRSLLEGQQAAATFHLQDLTGTGVILDWFVSEQKAFALYERLFGAAAGLPHVGLDKGYSQIVGEWDIAPGPHTYAIRYERGPAGPDRVEYFIDGEARAGVEWVGVPLTEHDPHRTVRRPLTWPALGDGEPLKDTLESFTVAHGLFSLLDEFPFNQVPELSASIPRSERLFGQGAEATFDDIVVVTTT